MTDSGCPALLWMPDRPPQTCKSYVLDAYRYQTLRQQADTEAQTLLGYV